MAAAQEGVPVVASAIAAEQAIPGPVATTLAVAVDPVGPTGPAALSQAVVTATGGSIAQQAEAPSAAAVATPAGAYVPVLAAPDRADPSDLDIDLAVLDVLDLAALPVR